MKIRRGVYVSAVIVGLLVGLIWADEAAMTPALPASKAFKNDIANDAMQTAAASKTKAKTEYEKAVITAKTKLISQLAIEQDKATKAGDLDEAIKLRNAITGLKTDIASSSGGGAAGPGAQGNSEDATKDQAALLEKEWEVQMKKADAESILLFIERRDETVCDDPAGLLVKVYGIAVRETHLGDKKDQARRQAFVLVSYTNNTDRKNIIAMSFHFLSNSFSRSVASMGPVTFNGKNPTAAVVGIGLREPDLGVDELKKAVKSITFTKWAVTSLSTSDGKNIELAR